MPSLLALSPAFLLLGIALLVLLIVVLMLVLLWRSKKQQEAEAQQMDAANAAQDSKEGEAPRQSATALPENLAEAETRRSVSSALNFLERNSIGRGSRYRSPWFLVLGASDSGKSTLLEDPGISLSLREGFADFGVSSGIKWRFFDAGVILDVPGQFFLGASDTTSDDRKWKSLLRNLVRFRPQRPFDGVVLTIPATELMGETALPPAVIGQRAACIFDKLWQLQKWTGLCFPVYVVITKCDLIPGFKAMAGQLPSQCKNEMFGWSNPYNLESAFDAAWIDQGFEELSYDLNRLQCEIFTERADIPGLDDLFLLSAKIQELRRPLRMYLNRIFKQSAYRESLQFRGFYFVGDASEEREAAKPVRALSAAAAASSSFQSPYSLLAPPPSTSIAPGDNVITDEVAGISSFATEQREHKPIFVADLFEGKIFPERGIAHPAARSYLSKNRTVIGLQIACLITVIVLGFGLWFGHHRFVRSRDITLPMLDRVPAGVCDPGKRPAGYAPKPDKDAAYVLIDGMKQLNGFDYRSLFYPTSLTGSMDEKVKKAMVCAFGDVVYATFKVELEGKKDRLLKEVIKGRDDDPAASSVLPLLSVDQTKGYSRLLELTTRLRDVEKNIDKYNQLASPGQGTPEELFDLENYLHDRQRQANFDRSNIYFREALAQGSGTRIEISDSDRLQASAKLKREVDRFLTEWMANSTILNYLDGLKAKLEALDNQEMQSYQQLADLKGSLDQAEKVFTDSRLLWLAKRELALFGQINDVTKGAIENSYYLSATQAPLPGFLAPRKELQDYIDHLTDKNFELMQSKLREEETSLTGPLVNLDNGLVKLSPSLSHVNQILEDFLALPFVRADGKESIRVTLRPDERLFWNKDGLLWAISLQDSYNRFAQGVLSQSDDAVRRAFGQLALTHLEEETADTIARAQNFSTVSASIDDDDSITAEVQNFQEVAESLGVILGNLTTLEMKDTKRQLLRITTAQAGALLLRIDHRFESQSPYAANINNFERWNGDNIPTSAGFETHGPDEVKQYLAFQRQQVQQYAVKATPLVKFLEGRIPSGGKEPGRALSKWQRIIDDLQNYTAKVPGTSLRSLEDFIGTDMDTAKPENCQTAVLTTAGAPGDYFAQTRETLRRALLNRCRILSEQNAQRAYARLAKLFNDHLAGKFPFSTPPQEQMPNEADPQDIVALYQLLDANGKTIHAGLRSGSFGNSYTAVQNFMGQLEALRPLFAPFLAAEGEPTPIFDFIPSFRVNQGREINGNQIIDWTLQVGADSFHFHEPPRAGRWSYGDPVKLTLRWAKDAPQQPLLGPASCSDGKPGCSVVENKNGSRLVTYEYHDNWALFAMLLLHRPPANDFDRMADTDPQTLVFNVDDNQSSDPGFKSSSKVNPQTKVFVRIKLRPPGKPDSLRLRDFPIEAPPLEQVQAQGLPGNSGGDNQ